MKVVCITSDGYRHLMAGFAERFNKHWGSDQKVTVLGYKAPWEELPANFLFESLGYQEDYGEVWTEGLIPYFAKKGFTEEHPRFILMLEDYWLNRDVDRFQLLRMENAMRSLPEVGKCDLTDDRTKFPHSSVLGFVVSCQTARYRSSLQAAMWDTDYFLGMLKPNRTIWEFELIGEKEAMNDGRVILGSEDGILHYDNVMLKGRLR